MTRGEADLLAMFVEEFREFRRDDRVWKQGVDAWRASVVEYIAGEQAVEERDGARRVSRRALVSAAIAAAGVVSTLVWNVYTAIQAH